MTDTQIAVGMNVDGVVTGTEKAKRKISELGSAVRDAGKGTGAIGDGMASSAAKVESATRNMVGSIQRQIAAIEAGDKSSRKYQESLARMRGIDVAALRPYLDQLDAVKAKQVAAAASQSSMGSGFAFITTGAFAAAAAIGAVGMAFKHIVDGVDKLNDLKDATGASIENISALEDVALRTGTSFDTVGAALIKFNTTLKDSKAGSDSAAVFAAIGVSVAELKTLDPAAALLKVSKALANFADDGNKARAMQELFGKSTRDVAALMKDLAEKGTLVGTVTTAQADEAERLNKEFSAMQKNITDVARDMSGPLVEAINVTIEKFKKARAEGKGFFTSLTTNYWDNVRSIYGIEPPNPRSVTGLIGGLDTVGEAAKPTVGDPLAAAAKAKADAEAASKAAAAAKKALDDQNKELAEQAKLLAELSGLTGSFAEDWARLSNIYKAGKISLDGLEKAQSDLLSKQPAIKSQFDAQKKAVEDASKAYETATKAAQKYYTDLAGENATLEESNRKLAEETALIGLSDEAKASMALARMDNAIAMEQEALAMLNLQNSSELEIATAQRRIDLMKEQRALSAQGYAKTIASNIAQTNKTEWDKYADQIGQSLTDQIMEGGRSGAEYLENLFRTMVLRPVIQGVVGAGINAIAGSAAASSMGFGTAAAGGAAGAAFSPASIGQFLGSPVGMAIVGLVALKSLGAFGSNFISAADSGRAQVNYSDAGVAGAVAGTTGSAAQIAAATASVDTLAQSYFKTAAALGIQAMKATFEMGSNTGREGAAPQTVLGVNIGRAAYSSGEIASGDAAGLQLAASRAVLTALQASTLPSYLSGVFDGITAGSATQDQITSALTSASALKSFNDQLKLMPAHFTTLASLSYSVTQGLISAAGGLEKLQTNLGTYYSNFYSSEEQRLQTIANINAATAGSGLDAATATRESFRQIVEAQDLSTESGRNMYAALIGVAGAFAGITPAANNATNAIEAATKAADAIYSAQTSQYSNLLSAQQAQADYAAQAAQASQQAAQESAQAAQQAAAAITQAFAQAGQGIADFVKTLLVDLANPATLQNSYLSDLAAAKGGDLQASQRLPASAKAYLDAQISNSATASDAAIARARMAAELSRLPAVKTYEQQTLDALNNIGTGVSSTVTAVTDLNGKLMVDLTVQAQSELLKILKFTADTAGLSPELQTLALTTVSTLDKTIALAVQQNDPYALAVALAQGGTVNTLFAVSGGDLTDAQMALINGINQYNKNVLIGVHIDASELTALQQQLMNTFGTIDLQNLGNAGIDLTDIIGKGQLDRLQSISAYIKSLTWDGSVAQANANLWKVYDVAKSFGVTQADLADASSFYRDGRALTLAELQYGFDSAGIPRFAAGSNYLPTDMIAQVHAGERIIPAADNRELMHRLQNPQENSAALVTEIRGLREENRAQAQAIVQLQSRMNKLMERWDIDGLPETR